MLRIKLIKEYAKSIKLLTIRTNDKRS